MKKAILVAGFLSLGMGTATADDVAEAKRAPDGAKLSFKDAIATAQKEIVDGRVIEIELDWENGGPRYEVEMLVGEIWKEVRIDGVSGRVLGVEKEAKPDDRDDKHDLSDAKKALEGAKQTFDQVRAAVAGEAKDARIVSIGLELRGGKSVYEVKALQGEKIAKVRVDAADGKVTK